MRCDQLTRLTAVLGRGRCSARHSNAIIASRLLLVYQFAQ